MPIGQLVLGLVRAPGHDLGIKEGNDRLLELLTERIAVGLLTEHNGAFFGCYPAKKKTRDKGERNTQRQRKVSAEPRLLSSANCEGGNRFARPVCAMEHFDPLVCVCGGRAGNVVP